MTTSTPEASRSGEGGFWTVFGTATLPTGASGASSRGEEPPDQRQTGLCSMQRPVILSPGLPPDLPDGFIRLPYRPSDRPALPTALPEALAGRVTWVIHTAHLTDGFRQPDFPTSRPPDLPAGFVSQTFRPPDRTPARPPDRPALPTARPAASPASHTSQPNQPARPTSPTGQPDRPTQPTSPTVRPACLTGRFRSSGPTAPSPAIHPGKGPAGRPYR